MLIPLFCLLLLLLPVQDTNGDESSDIVCKKGRLSKKISVSEVDSFEFRTQAGATYAPKTSCHVKYRKEASCPKMRFYCPEFNVNNKHKNCEGKDIMLIQVPQTKKAYCQGKGPNVTTSANYLKVSFISDKRKQSSGAICRVKCVETADAAMFRDFQMKYNKSYSNRKEKVHRFKIWKQRRDLMQEHNKLFIEGKKAYRKGENSMFDMTLEEIEANYMGLSLQHNSYTSKVSRVYIDISDVPSSINWVEKGYVTSVQNQAGCGSCWAHSAAGALEGAYKKDTNRLVKIDVDYLISCATPNWCKGSYPGIAYSYVMFNGIVVVNETYRSQASNSFLKTYRNLPKDPLHETHGTPKRSLRQIFGFPTGHPLHESGNIHTTESFLVNQHSRRIQCLLQNNNIVVIRSISRVNHGREDELMQAVAEIGPVSVIICAPLDLVDFSGEGDDVFYEENCSEECDGPSQVNHAVLVVGYGEQKNERTNKNKPYWLVKNSWGTDWGKKGYIKMARNQDNNCGIASYATYPSVWGHLICGKDLDILLAEGEGKFAELNIQCCGGEEGITCISEECRKACGGKEPIQCLKPVEEFTDIEHCETMNRKIAQVKITRIFCKYIAPCPRLDGSNRFCSCCKYSYYYRGYKKCAPKCNARYCPRSAPVDHDESASDLICQDDLNETDVLEDLNLYFSNLTDADTSLKVLCCSNGITTPYNCTGSDCSQVCGGDLTCIKMVDRMEFSGHCYEDVMLVPRTEDSCKFAPCPSIVTNTKFCKCCEFPSYNEKCPETCSSCPSSTVQGVLITGGHGAQTSTELFLPHTGKTCSLQSLPAKRHYHSMDTIAEKIILCGGYDTNTRTSCLEFLPTSSTGSWANYATLAQGRYLHTTHVFQDELLLLGGDGSGGTTEIIGKGTQFNLQQDTLRACSIPDQSSTILTGGISGSSHLNSVVRYNYQGFVENLPDLATARRAHGCGYYMDNGNKVLVVAGGYNGADLSSTELLPAGATAWTSGESLPRTLCCMPSVTMDNYLLLIGGYSGGNRGEVLKFDGTWTEVGMMKTVRERAGATKIEIPGEGGLLDISACI